MCDNRSLPQGNAQTTQRKYEHYNLWGRRKGGGALHEGHVSPDRLGRNITWTNSTTLRTVVENMSMDHYFQEPQNLPFHNLCDIQIVPPGATKLLGLGPKFPLHENDTEEYNPRRYIRSLWKPDPIKNTSTYLLNTAQTLRDNNDVMVILADKNQGFCVTNTITYNEWVHEHLSDRTTYEWMKEVEAKTRLRKVHKDLEELTQEYYEALPQNEKTYYDQAMNPRMVYADAVFYLNPKVHKEPIGKRLVCASSYIKDGVDLLRQLRAKGRLSRTAHLFLASDFPPHDFLIRVLCIVLLENIFTIIVPRHNALLDDQIRFIDDMTGIIDDPTRPNR